MRDLAYARQRLQTVLTLATAYRHGLSFGKSVSRPQGSPAAEAGALETYFDQNTIGPGLWKWRHYFPVYERHLGRLVGKKPTVLEIGIYSGGGLKMWRNYFGEGAKLVGLDIESACRTYADDDTRIFIGDQADHEFLRSVVAATPEGLDAILDDGGHEAHQQIATFEELFAHLRPGGVYICEDVHFADHPFAAYVAGLAANLNAMENLKENTAATAVHGSIESTATAVQASIESIALYPFMVVIEKRATSLDRLEAPKHGTEWQPFYD